MITCGIDLQGSEAILVMLRKKGSVIEDITGKFKRISIADDTNFKEVRSFFDTINNHFNTMSPERIAIIKRSKTGPYAAGGMSFKIEGLIQLYPNRNVPLISPLTINAYKKKNNINSAPVNKYQQEAYFLAHYLLHL